MLFRSVLQTKNITAAVASDFFDFSIYLDGHEDDLHRWYVNRFMTLRQTAFRDPKSYFRRYAEVSEEQALHIARGLWARINLVNVHILEIREEIDGIAQLTFSSEKDRQKALELLKTKYKIIER